MRIKINKDFLSEYKNEIWKGFSPSELISFAVGAGGAFGVGYGLYHFLGLSPATAVYCGMPVMLIIVFVGFYRIQGYLTIGDYLREMYETKQTKQLSCDTSSEAKEMKHCFFMKYKTCRPSARYKERKK